MRCISCGLKITDSMHITDYGCVCDRCWNDPNLFFPEKLNESAQVKIVHELFSDTDESEYFEIPTIKMKQKDITLYSGKMKAKELLKLYAIFGFEEQGLSGYQREMREFQLSEISEYLQNCPAAIMPGLFISIRDGINFRSIDNSSHYSDFGLLKIQIKRGSIWIIDGQHRVGGFEKIFTSLGGGITDNQKFNTTKLLDYEIPVTFIDTKEAVSVLNHINKMDLNPVDIERLAFFIINKTQRRLSPSLKDTLQYCLSRVGVTGIPVIEREKWRTEAVALGIDFNSDIDSPLYLKINISGQSGLERPIQLNSFVSSLKPLYKHPEFNKMKLKEKRSLLITYWREIKKMYYSAFSEKTYRNYLLLKTMGVYTLNWIIKDYIEACIENGKDILKDTEIKKFIRRLKGFDWEKSTSILAGFGGMNGVKEAREIILNYMNGQDGLSSD